MSEHAPNVPDCGAARRFLHAGRVAVLATATVATLAACAGAADSAAQEDAAPQRDDAARLEQRAELLERRSVERVPEAAGEAPLGEVPDAMMQRLQEDLRTHVGDAVFEVVRAEALTWSDGALGCPKPGQMYTQALVPGYRVVFAVDGREYDYHMAESGYFVLCEGAVVAPSAVPGGTPGGAVPRR